MCESVVGSSPFYKCMSFLGQYRKGGTQKRNSIQYLTIRTSREYPVMARRCCQCIDFTLVIRLCLQKRSMLTIPKLNITITVSTNKSPTPEPKTLVLNNIKWFNDLEQHQHKDIGKHHNPYTSSTT